MATATLLSMNITTCILVAFIVNVVTFILFYIFYKVRRKKFAQILNLSTLCLIQMRNKEYGTVYLLIVTLLVAVFWIAALIYFQLLKETNSDVSSYRDEVYAKILQLVYAFFPKLN